MGQGRSSRRAPRRRRHLQGAALALAIGTAAVVGPGAAGAGPAHGASPQGHDRDRFQIEVLSGRADQVSGGDALVQVTVPRGVRTSRVEVELGRADVTDAFARQDDGTLVGLVDGLAEGRNTLTVRATGRGPTPRSTRLTLVNHPIGGPIFSGPQQQPFVCTTTRGRFDGRPILGQPLVDNQDHFGIPVAAEGPDGSYPQDGRGYPTAAAEIVGWSSDCAAETRYRLRLPHHRRRLPLARRPHRAAAGRRRHRHDDGRRHRALRRPLGARHDQPLRLQRRHPGPDDRDRPGRARRQPVEPAPGVQLRRRRRHRPQPGHAPTSAACCPPTCSARATA